ncbi:MAG: SurA N-terminal domain-containing protein [Burkholderiales bacterium]|nr:SurA N-terminal domain-containing protein [Burkholderiales bacterium]
MFDFVRKHTRVMQLVLFLLIFPSFVLFGLEGYNRMQEKGETVARVDGRDITQADWDNDHKREVDRLREQMPNLDVKMLDSPEMKYATLERMVRDRVLDAAAHEERLTASDNRVAREIHRNPLVAQLRGPDGKLDMARYKAMLAQQGMTPELYEKQMRADLSARQVLAGLGNSAFATPAIVDAALGAYYQKREIQVAVFSPADFMAKVSPTDAEVGAFYQSNLPMFQAPEQADIEYVVLDLEGVMKTIAVNEQDVKTYYEQNAARYGTKETRRASHILVKDKAKAEELLAAVKKNPASFADLAKKNSQDPGSAPQGGDLDWFGRGAMTKAFEDKVFAMKPGDVDMVQSEFGFHVIKLVDAKAATQKPFDQVRPEIEADMKKQQAQRKYAESAEQFSNTVYEQSDSLKPAAEKLKLEVRMATVVGRKPPAGATGALANPKFLAALFAPDAVEKKRNTEAMEVGTSQMASGRVKAYTPARARPLAEVKDEVRTRLVAQRASELAKKEGEARLAAWKAAPATAALPAAVQVSRTDAQKQQPEVVDAALRADPTALPAWAGVTLKDGSYAVVKVGKIVPREAPAPQQAQQERAQFARMWATAENLAYYEVLKEKFKAEIKVAKPAEPKAQ